MKMKKLLALVLSAVMAVTMLTACGGGGGSSVKTVSVDRSEVEALYAAENYEINVGTSSNATTAAKQVAKLVEEKDYGAVTQDFLSTELSRRLDPGVNGMYMFASQAQVEASSVTVESLVAGTIWTLYSAGLGSNYGVVVVDVTTADGVPCYLSVAVAQ